MQKHESDFPAAVTGLLVGALVLAGLMTAVMMFVNQQHAGGDHAAAPAGQVSHN